MRKKLSRRDFARTSAASAAAVALPNVLFGSTPATETSASAKGAAVAKEVIRTGRFAPPPPNFSYGGDASSATAQYRNSISLAYAPAYQDQSGTSAPAIIKGWREGTTIPAEYYLEEKHYADDERFLATNLWFLADHEARIPKAGDYFVFEFGRGESAIVLRDKAGAVKAYHNVCRHRGSRLCRHDEDPVPQDARLSVKQLTSSGNTPVFRCPYHAWTYDLDGKLISAPNGMPGDFDMTQNGLRPCNIRTAEGFIFLNFSSGDAPEFDSVVKNFSKVAREYGTAQLKIAARIAAPTKANWKLVLENFQECYHCAPAHKNLVTTHPFWDGLMPKEQRARLATSLQQFIPADKQRPQGGAGMGTAQPGDNLGGDILNVNFVSGTVDGKAAAPLLPTRKEWTHRSLLATTGWSTGYIQCYDDHVAVARFTPRGVRSTDAELFWLVNPDAKEGKDYKVEQVTSLWDITYREDRWIVENNHQGIESGFYGGGRYAAVETGPSHFIKWYMSEVVKG
jgi:phenylpropionate dioxygenase-like ring-hydroxylating dioxygenase large terminal subunit